MSGIAGIYYVDGRPVERGTVQGMVNAMAHRGPDGLSTWHEGAVGLGHAMLHTTPESLHETQPLVHRRGDLVLTADARIDNRADLIRALRPPRPDDRPITDAELILAAYEQWGAECPEHLLGAFAFAIWDAREQRLFCARDHFGVKQLYVHHVPDRRYAVATEIKALHALPNPPKSVDEVAIGQFFTKELVDRERTMYRSVNRFMPGHCAIVSATGALTTREYWTLNPESVSASLPEEDCVQGVRERFLEAVQCRLRSAFPVGSDLSGGLDSSSVTCAARQLRSDAEPLATFSVVSDRFPDFDERSFIHEVEAHGAFAPHYAWVEAHGYLDLLEEMCPYLDDARASGNHYLNWIGARSAGRAGVRVLLTGKDGDTTVSHGLQHFAELVEAQQWSEFAALADQFIAHRNRSIPSHRRQIRWKTKTDILRHYASPQLIRWAKSNDLRSLIKALFGIGRHFEVSTVGILRNLWRALAVPPFVHRYRSKKAAHDRPRIVDPSFADRIDLQDRIQAHVDSKPSHETVREEQYRMLTSPYLLTNFETVAHYAAAWGIEARHPFMDKRLIEYCLGLPPRLSIADGWTRYVMRKAMDGILPERIQWRTDKTSLSGPFRHLHLERNRTQVSDLVENPGEIGTYVNMSHFRSLFEKGREMTDSEAIAFGKVITLIYWWRCRIGKRHIAAEGMEEESAPGLDNVQSVKNHH